MIKLAVIGGSSPNTPQLFECLKRRDLAVDEVALIGRDFERTGTIAAFCRRLCAELAYDSQVTAHVDLEAGIEGARVVFNQARLGGAGRWFWCNHVAKCFKLGAHLEFNVAALINLNEVLDIGRAVVKTAPYAYLIEFTNPCGIHCEALARQLPGLRFISGCPSALRYRSLVSRLLGAPDPGTACGGVELEWVGFNHFAWIQRISRGGKDVTRTACDIDAGQQLEWDPRQFERLGVVPVMLATQLSKPPEALAADAEDKARALKPGPSYQQERRARYACFRDETVRPTVLLEQNGRKDWYERVLGPFLEGLLTGRRQRYYSSMLSEQVLPSFPGRTVECAIAVGGGRVSAVRPTKDLPDPLERVCRGLRRSEELLIEAALDGRRSSLIESIVVNPLCGCSQKARRFADFVISELRLNMS